MTQLPVPTGLGRFVCLATSTLLVAGAALCAPLSLGCAPTSSAPDSSRAAPSEPPTVEWAGPTSVATGAAYRGPWRMNASDWRFVDDPTVALTEGGTALAWVDHAAKDVFFQRYDASGAPAALPGAPVNVSRSPEVFSWLPRVAVPQEENPQTVYVLWQEIVFSGGTHGGEIFFARSTDGGQTFSAPINLSSTQAGAGKGRLTEHRWHNGSFDLAVGPEGRIFAAWTEYEGPLRVSRSTDGGKTFSAPIHVAGSNAEPARGPTLAVDTSGAVHLAWTVGGDPAADIHYARSEGGGRSFSSPTEVAASDRHADAPTLATGHAGRLHLVYGESREASANRARPGAGRRYRIRYTRLAGGGEARFTAPTTVSRTRPWGRVPEKGRAESAHFPSLQVGRPDTVVVLWERFPEAGERPRGLSMAVSRDGGETFTAPARIPGSSDSALGFNGSQQGLLMEKLAVGPQGRLAVVNSRFRRGEASRIRLYRGQLTNR